MNGRCRREFGQVPAGTSNSAAGNRKCRHRIGTLRQISPSQIRTALASIVWNTGASSPGELPDDLENLPEVAVCRSSASLKSSVRSTQSSSRVFSMAMTACAAKFCTRSICLSVKLPASPAGKSLIAPIRLPSLSIGTASRARKPAELHGGNEHWIAFNVAFVCRGVRDVNRPFLCWRRVQACFPVRDEPRGRACALPGKRRAVRCASRSQPKRVAFTKIKYCRTSPRRKAASRFPAWLGTPAPVLRAKS